MTQPAAPRRIVVLDFDGTVCLGDDPVLSYARHLDLALTPAERVVEETVREFLLGPAAQGSGTRAAHLETVVDAADGYAAAATLAIASGVSAAQLGAAYDASRAELASGALTTWAPAGLGEFLRSLDATVVLVTNATETGVGPQLESLGIADLFDEIVTSANKPVGMAPVLTRLREAHGLADAPERLLSVGDIWRNDLAPAAEQGSATALIERFRAPEAAPTFRAATFEELYAPIAAWARA